MCYLPLMNVPFIPLYIPECSGAEARVSDRNRLSRRARLGLPYSGVALDQILSCGTRLADQWRIFRESVPRGLFEPAKEAVASPSHAHTKMCASAS